MELIVKHFNELTVAELEEIYRLRVSVFVVEQNCPYMEIDGFDKFAYHLFLRDGDGIKAYARALPQNTVYEEASIGRIISIKRRCGLGSQIVNAAVETARDKFGASRIKIGAQVYARSLYEKAGFKQISDEYIEDGIPHIHMMLEL